MTKNTIQFGEHIMVHNHISDLESWFLTIRPLKIFGESLCKKTCTEQEIARYINVRLHKELNTINLMIRKILPFT